MDIYKSTQKNIHKIVIAIDLYKAMHLITYFCWKFQTRITWLIITILFIEYYIKGNEFPCICSWIPFYQLQINLIPYQFNIILPFCSFLAPFFPDDHLNML